MLAFALTTLCSILTVITHPPLERRSGHQVCVLNGIMSININQINYQFTLTNKCGNSVQPVIADTRCGYSPRMSLASYFKKLVLNVTVHNTNVGCSDAVAYSGPQPNALGPGQSQTVTINSNVRITL
jgi:hypothetical protein